MYHTHIYTQVFRLKRSTKTLLLFMLTGLVMIAINKAVLESAVSSSKNSIFSSDFGNKNTPFLIRRINSYSNFILDKIDWTDYKYLELEANRAGNGERGEPTILSEDQLELSKTLAKDFSYNVLTSDMISLDRSIPDVRHEG